MAEDTPATQSGSLRLIARLPLRFVRDRNGATAVEFAMVAMPFLAILFAILEVAFMFLAGQALDTSLDAAARELMTGRAQSSGNINSQATFIQNALCPKLPAIIDCSQVQVNVSQLSDFNSANLGDPVSGGQLNTASWGYQPCASAKIMKVEAIYPIPALTSFWTSAYTATIGGVKERVLYSAAVFQCEPF